MLKLKPGDVIEGRQGRHVKWVGVVRETTKHYRLRLEQGMDPETIIPLAFRILGTTRWETEGWCEYPDKDRQWVIQRHAHPSRVRLEFMKWLVKNN